MKRVLALLLVCFCVCLCLATSVSAADLKIEGVTTISRSETDRVYAAQNLKLELLDNDNFKPGICSFDVSKEGKIALAIEHGRIYVYDADGNFLYGYRFYPQGAYGVVFAGENVAIYLVRGEVLAIYDPEGNCIDLQDVIYPDNPGRTWLYQRISKQQDGKTYMLQRNVELMATYGRLVITDEDGNRYAFYDISLQHTIGVILFLAGIVGFLALVIGGFIKKIRNVEEMEGIWYCRELKMQVSFFDPNNAFTIRDGEKIKCRCEKNWSKYSEGRMEVFSRELDNPKYKHGKNLLVANILSYGETSMVVYDRKTHQEYVFVRTDKIG